MEITKPKERRGGLQEGGGTCIRGEWNFKARGGSGLSGEREERTAPGARVFYMAQWRGRRRFGPQPGANNAPLRCLYNIQIIPSTSATTSSPPDSLPPLWGRD